MTCTDSQSGQIDAGGTRRQQLTLFRLSYLRYQTSEATLHLLPVLDTETASTSANAKCGVSMSSQLHPDFNVSGWNSGSVSCTSLFPAPLPILKVEVPWYPALGLRDVCT